MQQISILRWFTRREKKDGYQALHVSGEFEGPEGAEGLAEEIMRIITLPPNHRRTFTNIDFGFWDDKSRGVFHFKDVPIAVPVPVTNPDGSGGSVLVKIHPNYSTRTVDFKPPPPIDPPIKFKEFL